MMHPKGRKEKGKDVVASCDRSKVLATRAFGTRQPKQPVHGCAFGQMAKS